MGIEASGDDDKLRPKIAKPRQDAIVECGAESLAAVARPQGCIDHRIVLAVFADRAGAGVERHLVRGAIHHRLVRPENLLRAVAVMHVEIDDRRAHNAVMFLRVPRRNGGIVEQAEDHRPRGLGVMAWRPRGDEGVGGFFGQHFVDGVNGAAGGAQGRFEAAGRDRSVGVELDQALRRRRIAQLRDVIHRVTQRDGLERRPRRLHARERLEFLRLERARDGAKPVGPLGMTVRGEVFETGGVADEKRGHKRDVLLRERRVGADDARPAFDDGALEPSRLYSEILGEKARQCDARAGIGIQPQRRERLLRQQTAAGGDGKQAQIGGRSGERFVRALVEVGKHPARRARQAPDCLLQAHAAPAERRIVGRVHRVNDAVQLAEICLDHRAAVERQLAGGEVDRLDAVGAFVDRGDACVTIKLRRAGFFDETHAAMHLHAEGRDFDADVGRTRLGDRRQQRGACVRRFLRGLVGPTLGAVERHRGRVADVCARPG